MRALTLTPFYPTASDDAAGCFVSESVLSLAGLGIAMEVIAVQPWYKTLEKPLPGPLSSKRLRYFALPGNMGLAGSGFSLYRSLRRPISKWQERPIDLIHAHAPLPCGHAAFLLSRRFGLPYVITVHGLDAFLTEQVRGFVGARCARIARQVYECARRVICISQNVAKIVDAGTEGRARVEVVHNGVDTTLFSPLANGDDDAPTVLSVGNLIPIKGHELLLRAIAGLAAFYPQLKCRVIGEGSERARLEALSRELGLAGRVEFLGRRSRLDVAGEMQKCTVFALPSRYEGLGCVYLEAMSSGKPVIACRGQGIEDVISSGETGFLVTPDQPEELADVLHKLLADTQLRNRMGKAARERILADLTLQHQAMKMRAIYQECAG